MESEQRKRGKKAGGREKRGRLIQGKIKFSLFPPLVFDGLVDVFSFPLLPRFFSLSLFFPFDTGSRDWITRVKPPGVSLSLPSLFFLPYMHSVTISVPGCVPGHLGNPALLECERKYFAHFYYLFICC